MRRITVSLLTAVVLTTGVFSAGPASAASRPAPPIDRPGPALTVSQADLDAALSCHGDFAGSALEPVLLNPATGVTVEQNYSWNYARAFAAQRRPWCTVDVPDHTLGDIQVAGEYIVHAIRTMRAMATRDIAIIGHSQGGMSMRWALRFWPDTRTMVDDVIGMAGSNHGTTALPICVVGVTSCAPAVWQQQAASEFVAALNSVAETFGGISYTEIYTRSDEVVTPPASAGLTTGGGDIMNVATQEVCPLEVNEHLTVGTTSPTAYALAMDALGHDGPAVPSRVSRSTCLRLLQPGVNPLNLNTYLLMLAAAPGLASVPLPNLTLVGVPPVPAEPALRCYATAQGC
jgi:hypothetical protein